MQLPHPPLAEDLQQLLARLQDEQYKHVTVLSTKIRSRLPIVKATETNATVLQYLHTVDRFNQVVIRHLRSHRLVLVPYISDLLHKEDEGHDCRACRGGCAMHHSERVREIETAHKYLFQDLESLKHAAMLLPEPTTDIKEFTLLRNDIYLLQEAISEVLFIEQSALLPMMLDLQRSIGAHG
jgi:hypothetical protein